MEKSPRTPRTSKSPKSPKSPRTPKSPKSPRFTTTTATYVISAHGSMLTSMLGTPQTKKYHAINIPENVELYTFVDLGKCVADYNTDADFACKLEKETQKEELKLSVSPAFKFIHERGKTNKFPELILTPDHTTPVPGYRGITHCIPEDYRTGASRGHEIIYNIDAKNTKDCVCCSIVSKSTTKPYNCEKNYSAYYKRQLEGYKYDPNAPTSNINKCGPILMSEAVKIIKAHSNNYYEPTCVIQIYVSACLGEIDLNKVVRYAQIKYEETKRIAFPPSPTSPTSNVCVAYNPHTDRISPKVDRKSSRDKPELEVCYAELVPEPNKYSGLSLEEMLDSLKKQATRREVSKPTAILKTVETREVSESEINLMNYYYEVFKHNTLTKVSVTNVVESLTDFNAIPLIKSLLSKYRLMYQHKIFDFITYKDAYIEVTSNLYDKFSGTHEEKIDQLERSHRSRDRNKLDFYFEEALKLLKLDGSDDSLSILPKFNEINLVNPFIRKESEYFLIATIYLQLKELIEKQKLKMGQGRRKKTLRKKYKTNKTFTQHNKKQKTKNKKTKIKIT